MFFSERGGITSRDARAGCQISAGTAPNRPRDAPFGAVLIPLILKASERVARVFADAALGLVLQELDLHALKMHFLHEVIGQEGGAPEAFKPPARVFPATWGRADRPRGTARSAPRAPHRGAQGPTNLPVDPVFFDDAHPKSGHLIPPCLHYTTRGAKMRATRKKPVSAAAGRFINLQTRKSVRDLKILEEDIGYEMDLLCLRLCARRRYPARELPPFAKRPPSKFNKAAEEKGLGFRAQGRRGQGFGRARCGGPSRQL